MIRGNVPDEWSRGVQRGMRELGPPQERWDWVDEFIRGIERLTESQQRRTVKASEITVSQLASQSRRVRWTAQEWANLHFLLWRVENGMVAE